jgi:hypothetical protein
MMCDTDVAAAAHSVPRAREEENVDHGQDYAQDGTLLVMKLDTVRIEHFNDQKRTTTTKHQMPPMPPPVIKPPCHASSSSSWHASLHQMLITSYNDECALFRLELTNVCSEWTEELVNVATIDADTTQRRHAQGSMYPPPPPSSSSSSPPRTHPLHATPPPQRMKRIDGLRHTSSVACCLPSAHMAWSDSIFERSHGLCAYMEALMRRGHHRHSPDRPCHHHRRPPPPPPLPPQDPIYQWSLVNLTSRIVHIHYPHLPLQDEDLDGINSRAAIAVPLYPDMNTISGFTAVVSPDTDHHIVDGHLDLGSLEMITVIS